MNSKLIIRGLALLLVPGLSAIAQTFTRVDTGAIVTDIENSRGGSWGDYDNDGDLDLFVANNGQNNSLYQNSGDGSFRKITTGEIVNDGGNSVGASWGDFDNDGDLDLFVANSGENNFLYQNNGDSSFTKIVSGVIVNDGGNSFGASWGDFDNDGDLDLFVANSGENNFLYQNNGDSSFTKIVSGVIVNDGGNSFGASWGDYDNDGDLDLFVANNAQNNFLYENNGDGSFRKIATGEIVTDGGNSYGGSWSDFDNDGDLDLFVTNYNQNNFLYQNNGDGTFARMTAGNIVNDGGQSEGSSWGDYDNDGDLDLFVANFGQNNFLYENNGDGSFRKIVTGVIVNDGGNSRGSCWGDYDNDGDLDLFVANRENNFLYRNDTFNNNWATIKCVGTVSNRSAIGAKVRVKAMIGNNKPVWQFTEISGQTGFGSQNSLLAEFGLGHSTIIDSIRVEWPSGMVLDTANVAVNQHITLREPRPSRFIQANFTADVTKGVAPLTVHFMDRSVANPSVTSWSWDFDNDGTIDSQEQHPVHTYTKAGAYSVKLIVSNAAQTNAVIKMDFIVVNQFTRITSGAIVNDGGSSSGSNWGDYDNDGDLDLFVANRFGEDNFLYKNNGDGTFTKITTGDIVNDGGNSRGSSWGDYDNDGDLDLFVANYSENNFLYENIGDGSFRKITVGDIVNDGGFSEGAAWGDYDNDGDLDLFVANDRRQDNFLYENNGDGTFSKITAGAIVNDGGNSVSCSWGDYDSDGDLDLFVANIHENNFLYENIGDGSFRKITTGAIVEDIGYHNGGSWGDYDNDGDLDLFVANYPIQANYPNNSLYENNGDGSFRKITSGDIVNDRANSGGGNWGDFDNDGDLDLFVANYPNNSLYENNGDGSFRKFISSVIVNDGGSSTGSSWGDYDNDGDLDLFVANYGENNFLYQNNGSNNNWITIKCVGTISNRSAIGARVQVKAVIGNKSVWQTQEISGQTGLASQNSLAAEFGLGNAAIIDSIKIVWPSRHIFTEANLGVNQFLTIQEEPFSKITTGDIVNDGGNAEGSCWGDYDNDGDLDLFVANDGDDNFLYQNNGDGTFSKITTGDIVNDGGASVGCSWGDYDNDGDLDLFVANNREDNFLYQNNGDGTFSKITAGAIVNDGESPSVACSWGDYDNDGDLDLFIANEGEDNFLYQNNGDGTFSKVTTGDIVNDGGESVGCSWGDYDNDGDLDLFVANNSEDNFLYQNNGDGTFSKVTTGDIVNDGGASVGGSWGDYDNDGDLDLFVTNEVGSNSLYKNNGDGTFLKMRTGDIVNDEGRSVGSSWGDYDNDGDLDLFVANNGGVSFLYQNNGDGTFSKITTGGIISDVGRAEGATWGDYDKDGDLDLFVTIDGADNILYQNNGFSNNWIIIRCVDTLSNRSAIGAKVRMKAVIYNKPVRQMQEISGQTGRNGQNSSDVEFGLGGATTIDSITIAWPSGTNQVLTNVSVNQLLTVTEIASIVVGHEPLSTAEAANDILLAATVKGDVISKVSLNYHQGGESRFNRVPMSDIEGSGIFQGRIQGGEVTANGLEYHIIASDIHGNTKRLPSIGNYSIQVRVAEGISRGRSQPSGNTPSSYRLVSIPLNLDDKSPKAVLEDDLGKYDKKEWRFHALRDDYFMLPSDSSIYIEYPNTSEMAPGKAFWLTVKREGKIIDTGAGISNPTHVDYLVPLHPGWNFIGNPFNFPIPIENLRLKSGESLQPRRFTGDWNDPVTDPVPRILPFDGYAVFNDSTEHVALDTLFINPDLTSSASSIAKSSQSSERDISWSIRIVAKCEEAQNSDNVLAFAKGASEGWDELDLPEPPVIGEYVSVYFSHPEWNKLAKNFCTDFRPSDSNGQLWEFDIKTNIRDKVNLTFEGIDEVPKELEVWLVDDALKITQNLREQGQYAVAGAGAVAVAGAAARAEHVKQLKLMVGKREFVDEKLAQARAIPMTYELSQNFPNPFNPATTIRYGLPSAERVTLKIYNLLGAEVASLVDNEPQAAGYHAAIWDGRDGNGRGVASGVYVYRLRAGNFVMTKKLALVK